MSGDRKIIDFHHFLGAVKSVYAGDGNQHKKLLFKQINSCVADDNSFLKFLQLAFDNASKSADSAGKHVEWDTKNGNLFDDLSKKKGSAKKSAAIHFLFLTFPKYRFYARVMNEAISLPLLIETDPKKCVWDEHVRASEGDEEAVGLPSGQCDVKNQENVALGIAGEKPVAWVFRANELSSVDYVHCTLDLSVTQSSSVENPVSFLAQMSIDRLYADDNVEFGINRFFLVTDIIPNDECEIKYFEFWKDANFVGENCFVKLVGSGGEGRLQVKSTGGILVGSIDLKECELFEIKPKSEKLDFCAEMIVQQKDTSLRAADGDRLSDINKEIVIKSLLAKNVAPEKRGDWIVIAKKAFSLEHRKQLP